MTEHTSHTARFPVPLTILTGFLGAGKTTLLNHILRADHGLRIAVLVNDFGAINIDTALIVGVEGETVSLSNGCICCTIRDDLLMETIRLLKRPDPPEYIIVETSGVSDPMAVAMTFLMPDLHPYIRVDSIVAVVDSEQIFGLDEAYTQVAMGQIDVADLVVLNKIDRLTLEQLAAVRSQISQLIPDARLLETSFGRVPLELLIGVGRYAPEQLAKRAAQDIHVHEAGESADHDHAGHSLTFTTWSWTSDEPLAIHAVQAMVEALPPTIYRCKGVLNLREYPDQRAVLQVAGRRAGLHLDARWGEAKPSSQIVVIASRGGLDADDLRARFEGCIATGESPPLDDWHGAQEWQRGDYYEI